MTAREWYEAERPEGAAPLPSLEFVHAVAYLAAAAILARLARAAQRAWRERRTYR